MCLLLVYPTSPLYSANVRYNSPVPISGRFFLDFVIKISDSIGYQFREISSAYLSVIFTADLYSFFC